MLTISPMQESDYQSVEAFLKTLGRIERRSGCNIIMVAKDREEILGVGVMILAEQYGFIKDIIVKPEYESMQLDYGMGKAMLNFIDRREIMDVYAGASWENVNFKKTLERLGFVERENKDRPPLVSGFDDVLYLNLEDYFTSHCGAK